MEGGAVVRYGTSGGGGEVAVGLVDQDQVGQFDDALLEPLQLVAAGRRQDQHEQVDHVGDRRLGLADPDGFDQHHIEPGRLAHQSRLARAARDAAERAGGRRGPDEGARIARKLLHARLVAEDRAARAWRRRIDRQHRDAVALADQVQAERLDEGRLADPGRAGDADAHRLAGRGQEGGEQRLRLVLMLGLRRLDARDRAGERAAVAGADRVRELVDARVVLFALGAGHRAAGESDWAENIAAEITSACGRRRAFQTLAPTGRGWPRSGR